MPWADFCARWATEHSLHTGREVLDALHARSDTRSNAQVPYLFPELADTTEEMEQAAADAGEIQAAGSRYVGESRGVRRR